MTNVDVYVLDQHQQRVPVGVPGELLIGGDGITRGYLGRPELTAEKFIPNAYSSEPGARLYRTGDLVRWLADGELEFLGRVDRQVKIRGFRIELGEIETMLIRDPTVREAIVIAREDTPGEKRLVAYLVGDSLDDIDVLALRDRLKVKLPEHMIPAAFVLLEAFPLTPSGKIDRQKLPAPGHERPTLQTDFAAPTTAVEKTLCHILKEVLQVTEVGVDDNFFELGGDSIMTRMKSGYRYRHA
jgi:acyl-coenzyme A synthetase/AMP-(fatty) acid ligase